MKKAAFYTLGCKVNQVETEALSGLFKKRGYQVVDFDDYADVYVINTCTVTHQGERKSRQIIRKAARQNPEAVIAVVGCYAQTSPDEVRAIPGVDLVVGTQDRTRLIELVEKVRTERRPLSLVSEIKHQNVFEEIPLESPEGRTRAFIKIQEGCNNYCAYCIIPYARGPQRSRAPHKVVEEATRLTKAGFKEIVLTGIHLGAYGTDFEPPSNLAAILRQLVKIDGLVRIRLGSVEPIDINEELIEVMANSPKICRHLHIPLQHGHDFILKQMRRRYTAAEYAAIVAAVKKAIPGIAISTDFIVGFPGETEKHFNAACQFVREVGFARLHVFTYSPRTGTPAATFPDQVPKQIKAERSRRLTQLGRELAMNFQRQFLHQELEVLVEQGDKDRPGWVEGLTDNYIRVFIPGTIMLRNQLVKVRLEKVTARGAYGEIV